MDAARHIGLHQRPDIFVAYHTLALGELRYVAAIAHRQILQLALAALIADRTIERMINQQEFHDRMLGGNRLRRARIDLHTIHHRRRAGRHALGRALHFHQAHAAIGRHAQVFVIAEARHVDARSIGGLDEHRALARLNGQTIDFYLDALVSHACLHVLLRPRPHGHGRQECCARVRCNTRTRGGNV